MLHYKCLQRLRQLLAGPSKVARIVRLALGTSGALLLAGTVFAHDAFAQASAHAVDHAVDRAVDPAISHTAEPQSTEPSAAPLPSVTPLRPNPAFAQYPRYEGMLDGRQIVLRIGVNPEDPEELNGEYQFLPNGPVILIAGGRDGNNLTLEESDDGTEISGQWVGFYATDGSLSGERMNVDQSDSRPFALKPQ